MPYHLFGEYFISHASTLPIHTSRGCPYRCGFCYSTVFHKRRYRCKSAKNVVEEIEYFFKRYGIRQYEFWYEDEFFIDVNRVSEICRLILERALPVRWWAFSRFNTFDAALRSRGDEFVRLLKSSGCQCLFLGAESGSQRLLDDILKKDIKLEQIYPTIQKLAEHSVAHRVSFLTCLPTETKEDIEATFRLIDRISQNNPCIVITVFLYAPLPGTSMHDLLVKEHGYKPPNCLADWGRLEVPLSPGDVSWLPLEHVQMCEGITLMSKLAFHKDFKTYGQYREFVLHTFNSYPQSYLAYLLTKLQRWRYEKRWFRYNYEMRLWCMVQTANHFFRAFVTNFILRRFLPPKMFLFFRGLKNKLLKPAGGVR